MAAGMPATRPSQEEGLPASWLRWDLPGLKGAETKGRQGVATDLWGGQGSGIRLVAGYKPSPATLRGSACSRWAGSGPRGQSGERKGRQEAGMVNKGPQSISWG